MCSQPPRCPFIHLVAKMVVANKFKVASIMDNMRAPEATGTEAHFNRVTAKLRCGYGNENVV